MTVTLTITAADGAQTTIAMADPVINAVNLCPVSGSFVNHSIWNYYAGTSTPMAPNVVGPTGLTDLSTIQEDNSTGAHTLGITAPAYCIPVQAGAAYTLSAVFKAGTRRYNYLGSDDGSGNGFGVIVDTVNWTAVGRFSGPAALVGTPQVIPLPSGCYRIVVSGSYAANKNATILINGSSAGTTLIWSYTGAWQTMIVGEVQFEPGSVLTSYHPTP